MGGLPFLNRNRGVAGGGGVEGEQRGGGGWVGMGGEVRGKTAEEM